MKHLSAVLLAALLLLAASDPGFAAPASKLLQIEQKTAQIRHLKQFRPVPFSFLSDREFDAAVRANLARGESDSTIELTQRETVLLGLLDRNESYRTILYKGITAQVLGLYDYYTKKLYVRKRAHDVFGVDRFDIAHEYTHALQDQHYDLQRLLPDQSALTFRDSDAVAAHHALVEGDAVNTEFLYISKAYSPKEIHELLSEPQPRLRPLPKSIQRQFDFPYTYGVLFAQTLYRMGGMHAVDAAYRRLPRSSYEIMHPSAYLKHWKPRPIDLHGVRGFPDWKQVDDDSAGALGYQLVLRQQLRESAVSRVIDAYRGDRYLFLESGQRDAMLLHSLWTTHRAAMATKNAWVASLHRRFPAARIVESPGGTSVQTAEVSVYLSVSGARLVVAYGPSPDIAQSLATAQTT